MLVGADLRGARLEGARLGSAVLGGADLARAPLRAADFTGAEGVSREQLGAAFGVRAGIGRTVLPEGMASPEHWHEAADAGEDALEHAAAFGTAYDAWRATLPPEPGDDADDGAQPGR